VASDPNVTDTYVFHRTEQVGSNYDAPDVSGADLGQDTDYHSWYLTLFSPVLLTGH